MITSNKIKSSNNNETNFAKEARMVTNVNNRTVSNQKVNVNDTLNVYNKGKAINTIVNGGYVAAYENGIISKTIVSNGGSANVYEGGSAFSTTLLPNTYMSVHDGSNSFAQYITATNATIFVNGKVVDTILNDGAVLYVYDDGIVSNTTINSNADLAASDQCQVYNTLINKGGNLDVYNQGTANETYIDQGSMSVFEGAIANDTTIYPNGELYVESQGTVNGVTAFNKALISVYSGGIASNVNLHSGATMDVFNNGSAYETTINSSAIVRGGSNALLSNTLVEQGGILSIGLNTVAIDNTVNGGQIKVFSTGQLSNTKIETGGNVTLSAKASARDTIINNGGYLSAQSNAILYDTTINSGGSLYIDKGGLISGTVNVNVSGSAVIWASAGGNVNMMGDNSQIIVTGLNKGGNATVVIDNFKGNAPGDSDAIIIEGVNQADVVNVVYEDKNGNPNPNYVTLILKNGSRITMNIIDAQNSGYNLSTSGNGQLVYEVCFLTGTMIRTLNGDIKVENLCIGDEVVTYDCQNNSQHIKKIKWIGHKTTRVNPDLPDDIAGYPVRILKNAIAPNVPYKDLLITPEHCLFFENKLVPARMLVNGMSIFYDHSITNYTYYHVETDTHSVIWSDGMLSESYLDTGNRYYFNNINDNIVLSPTLKQTKEKYNLGNQPYLTTNREFVEPIYKQLLNQAKQLNLSLFNKDFILTDDPHFYVETENGQLIYPHAQNDKSYVFAIPSDVETLQLHSLSNRPCDTIGPFVDDRRELGLLIGNITLFDCNKIYKIDTHLMNNQLNGWYTIESNLYRWTNGNATLPIGNYTYNKQKHQYKILVIQVIACGPYLFTPEHTAKIA